MGSFWSEEKNEEEFSPPQQQNDWVIEAQRFRNPGVSILKEILKNIKLDEDLIRENNAILHEFLRTFIYKLKEVDELFDLLFSEFRYFGSFYSDLRVSTPDEFDINMVFRLPVKDSQFEIVHQP
ncbi:cyclic GMP-AMP synthase-like receptor isoform X2 [Parasteatoda tepidariorum]|uniref:cyclic GMP-AMP synthase-like receptor isoform X1 n=1 Tax=Parasteatoda tepidariorum TaxID=114398 RepID=UPI0039BD76E5